MLAVTNMTMNIRKGSSVPHNKARVCSMRNSRRMLNSNKKKLGEP